MTELPKNVVMEAISVLLAEMVKAEEPDRMVTDQYGMVMVTVGQYLAKELDISIDNLIIMSRTGNVMAIAQKTEQELNESIRLCMDGEEYYRKKANKPSRISN